MFPAYVFRNMLSLYSVKKAALHAPCKNPGGKIKLMLNLPL